MWTGRPAGLRAALGAIGLGLLAGCARPAPPAAAAYVPRTRAITITAVPLLVREQERVLPFLHAEFAKGGVLEGREVYAFVPSTITAVAGDTLRLHLVNPEDDVHTFVLPGLSLTLPGGSVTDTLYVTGAPGIVPFVCNLPAHEPMMWGQLVVLSPRAVGEARGER